MRAIHSFKNQTVFKADVRESNADPLHTVSENYNGKTVFPSKKWHNYYSIKSNKNIVKFTNMQETQDQYSNPATI